MSELSKNEVGELQKMLTDKRETLRVIRHGSAGSRSRNVREGRGIRKEIARIMTELRAREIASTGKKG